MSENEHNHNQNEVKEHHKGHDYKPYWKRAHRSITFWVFVFLMFVGIVYYIISMDFAFAPRTISKPQTENTLVP